MLSDYCLQRLLVRIVVHEIKFNNSTKAVCAIIFTNCYRQLILKDMEKVNRNGKVAVLISHGFGAGWYTWSSDNKELLFNPKLVEMVENGKANEIDEDWVKENLGIDDVYCGGAKDLKIHWLDVGTAFVVEEYDGAESLRTLDDLTIVA